MTQNQVALRQQFQRPPTLPVDTIVFDDNFQSWKIGNKLGDGTFGDVYEAWKGPSSNLLTHAPFAIKMDIANSSFITNEEAFFTSVASVDHVEKWKTDRHMQHLGIPQVFVFGDHDACRFMVMKRYGRDFTQQTSAAFHIKTLITLCVEIIDVLEFMHFHGYIHSDVKAANVVRGLEPSQHAYVIDYGLSSQITGIDPFNGDAVGTTVYMSRDAHIGDRTYRGDLETLCYNMIEWWGGRLPWRYCKQSERVHTLRMKSAFKTSLQSVAELFPEKNCPKYLSDFMRHVFQLDKAERPDYEYLKFLLKRALREHGMVDDGLLDIDRTPTPAFPGLFFNIPPQHLMPCYRPELMQIAAQEAPQEAPAIAAAAAAVAAAAEAEPSAVAAAAAEAGPSAVAAAAAAAVGGGPLAVYDVGPHNPPQLVFYGRQASLEDQQQESRNADRQEVDDDESSNQSEVMGPSNNNGDPLEVFKKTKRNAHKESAMPAMPPLRRMKQDSVIVLDSSEESQETPSKNKELPSNPKTLERESFVYVRPKRRLRLLDFVTPKAKPPGNRCEDERPHKSRGGRNSKSSENNTNTDESTESSGEDVLVISSPPEDSAELSECPLDGSEDESDRSEGHVNKDPIRHKSAKESQSAVTSQGNNAVSNGEGKGAIEEQQTGKHQEVSSLCLRDIQCAIALTELKDDSPRKLSRPNQNRDPYDVQAIQKDKDPLQNPGQPSELQPGAGWPGHFREVDLFETERNSGSQVNSPLEPQPGPSRDSIPYIEPAENALATVGRSEAEEISSYRQERLAAAKSKYLPQPGPHNASPRMQSREGEISFTSHLRPIYSSQAGTGAGPSSAADTYNNGGPHQEQGPHQALPEQNPCRNSPPPDVMNPDERPKERSVSGRCPNKEQSTSEGCKPSNVRSRRPRGLSPVRRSFRSKKPVQRLQVEWGTASYARPESPSYLQPSMTTRSLTTRSMTTRSMTVVLRSVTTSSLRPCSHRGYPSAKSVGFSVTRKRGRPRKTPTSSVIGGGSRNPRSAPVRKRCRPRSRSP